MPQEFKRKGLFPVGRLDRDTTGLLLITDDGDFAHKVMAPKKQIFKTYEAELDGTVTKDMCEKFKKGVVLADGSQCQKAELTPVGDNGAIIKICEGKYHQIKRMFGVVGLGVNSLKRTAVGGLELPEDLALGECRELEEVQIVTIFDI